MITFKSDRVRNFCWIFIFPTLKLGSVVFQTPRGEADSQSPLAVGATAKQQQNALVLAGGHHTCWEFAVTVGLLLDRAGFGVANRDFFIAAGKKKVSKNSSTASEIPKRCIKCVVKCKSRSQRVESGV